MKQEIKDLLTKLEFVENSEKSGLYQKYIDESTMAYVDFRKPEHATKGRRFVRQGDSFDTDPDTVASLKSFKEERDKILQSSVTEKILQEGEAKSNGDVGKKPFSTTTSENTKLPQGANSPSSPKSLLDMITEDYEADILEVFGDSGSCKTKLVVALALEGRARGKKVRFVDTERNLRKAEISALGDSYQYIPDIQGLDNFCKKIPTAPDIVIIDSIGYPILTEFSKMTANQKGSSLMKLIAWFGDLKDWAINNNKLVIVTNQPDSDFAKEAGYINRPFGDKARFAAKEIWVLERLGMKKGTTTSAIRTFRSRIKGYGLDVAQIEITDRGTNIKVFPAVER